MDQSTIDARITGAEEAIAGLMDIIGGKNTKASKAAMKTATKARNQRASIWCWRHLTDQQADTQLAGLADWVGWLVDRYPKALRELPPCWPLHPDALEEFTALWEAWHCAYYGDDDPRETPMQWHDRWLPGMARRLLGTGGVLTQCAATKRHRGVNLDGAPRNNFAPITGDESPEPVAG